LRDPRTSRSQFGTSLCCSLFFLARRRRSEPGPRPLCCSASHAGFQGRERCGGPGGVPGARFIEARPGPWLRTCDLSTIAENRVFVFGTLVLGRGPVGCLPASER
jgi:hypothetical protein